MASCERQCLDVNPSCGAQKSYAKLLQSFWHAGVRHAEFWSSFRFVRLVGHLGAPLHAFEHHMKLIVVLGPRVL